MTITALNHCKTLDAAQISPICFSETKLIVSVGNEIMDVSDGYFLAKGRYIECDKAIQFCPF